MTRNNPALEIANRAIARELIKQAVGGQNTATPTLKLPSPSLGAPKPIAPAPSAAPKPSQSILTSGAGTTLGGPKPLTPPRPQQPDINTWGGYIRNTNMGLAKDVKDTFTHFVPQNTMPWTDAWSSAPQRYKNLPVDRGLAIAGTAAAGTGLAAGTGAAVLAGAPAAVVTTAGRAIAPIAQPIAAAAGRVGAAIPEPVKQIASYATGYPLSKNVSTVGLIGSGVAIDAAQSAMQGNNTASAGGSTPAASVAQPEQLQTDSGAQPNQPAAPVQDGAVRQSIQAALAPNAAPELKQQAKQDLQGFMQQQVDGNPQFKVGAAELVAGKNTPAAQKFNKHLENVGVKVKEDELRRLFAENPNATPEQAGGFVAQAQQSWDGLPPEAKMMVGLGGGVGLVGLAMSLFGGEEGGGLMPMLMAILGLGGAAFGAAGSGMFGDAAQQTVGSGVRGVVNFFGAGIPEGDQDLSALLAQDPVAAASQGSMLGALTDPNGVKEKLQQAEQLKKLTSLPSVVAVPLLRALDPKNITTNEQAQLAYNNAMTLRQELENPESALAQKMNQGQQLVNLYDRATGWFN